MKSRAEHWISIGMVVCLCFIDERIFSSAAQNPFVQSDLDLTTFLKGGEFSYVEEIMEYHFDYKSRKDDKVYSIDPIVNVKTYNDENSNEGYNYTPEIAVAFHRLLISSLLSYIFRLRIVETAVKAMPESTLPESPVAAAFNQLHISTQLLFVLSHSRLFKMHLKMLSHHLQLPTDDAAQTYIQEFVTITLSHERHLKDNDLINQILGSNNPPPEPCPESVQAPATEESDAGTDELPDAGKETDVIFRRWIMGLVDHYASIRVLERVSRRLPPEGKIKFTILGLNRSPLPNDSWDKMVGEIRSLCQDISLVSQARASIGENLKALLENPDLASKAIQIIETKINKFYLQDSSVNKTSLRFETMVYNFFKDLISQKPNSNRLFAGCNHCEAILMAIIHRISTKNDLDFSLEVCSP